LRDVKRYLELNVKINAKLKLPSQRYILEEVSNFTSKYYADNLPSVHNPLPRYNTAESNSTLSLFRGQLGSASAATIKTLDIQEWRAIMLYVLTNLSEVLPYIE